MNTIISPPENPPQAPADAEPNIFLPRGRIGVTSMLFRNFIGFLLLLGIGLLKPSLPPSIYSVLSTIVTYGFIAFSFINAIKRVHDMGHGGIAVIIFYSIPIILLLPGMKLPNQFGPVPTRWL